MKISDKIKESRERIKKKAEENGRIAQLAKDSFKNVHGATEKDLNIFILGFLAGYKSKEKGE